MMRSVNSASTFDRELDHVEINYILQLYPRVEDNLGNLFLIYGKPNAYRILDLVHNRSIPAYCTLVVLVNWSSVRDPDIPSADNLIILHWLFVVEVICQVVECRYLL
jgi:hypothetical protein